jgi:UDP-N-acetylglucosamine--N-acetylmuramyl-(pentapeptide) pyrophosphoryl-undecaprenol N-acetylglucosamine transferase
VLLDEMRVLIAAGGTGGHLYPGIAVAQRLRQRRADTEILFVGTRRGIEQRVLEPLGFPFRSISARALPLRRSPAAIPALASTAAGFLTSLYLCLRFRPDVVVGTGAYVSAPVVLAGKLMRRPCVVLEQNRVPGRTNRLLARVADEVHVSFSESRRYFHRKDNLKLTGNPVREGIVLRDRMPVARKLALALDKTTLLVFGGSRGAHRLNQAVVDALPFIERIRKLQLILQTGEADHAWVKNEVGKTHIRAVVEPFLTDIAEAYCMADLVLCRAGATTIAEITACGLAAILVPYPHAADQHQLKNAEKLVSVGAAEMILDQELTGKRLARVVRRLVMSDHQLRRMAVRARMVARPEAADRVARSIERLAGVPAPPGVSPPSSSPSRSNPRTAVRG